MAKLNYSDTIPERKHNSVRTMLEEFMSQSKKFASVEYSEHEYSSASSCAGSYSKSAEKGGFPIEVELRDGTVWLIRKDI